jgi:hypothetical protein
VFFPQGCISRKGVLPAEPTLPVRPLFPECIPMDDQRIVPRKPKAGGAGVLPAEPTLPVGPLFRECIPIDNQRIVPLCYADQSFCVAARPRPRTAFEPHLNYFAHDDVKLPVRTFAPTAKVQVASPAYRGERLLAEESFADAPSTRFQLATTNAAATAAHLAPKYSLTWPFSWFSPTFGLSDTPYLPGEVFERRT